ncbi:unnamed protein product [Dibothriocephalus latus]|uniref:G-protein coupled receptors family 1 profile domain-containing protein n=1 Tax=Dibothriocephalus latus TaxID=60516 RepID=A0A3P6SSC1_DIBLA|nr:unnamed protein product [Dibothriocephalus latus]
MFLDEDIAVRCDRVRKRLEPPYEGPFRVLSRNEETCRILRGDKEDVISINRIKVAVTKEPPDLPPGQTCAFSLISLIEETVGLNPNTGNVYIGGLICLLWSSRFIFWYTYFKICQSIFYFACNRASEMLQIKNYPIIAEKQRVMAYMSLVFIGSLIGALPSLLLAFPLKKDCACALLPENFCVFTVLYAHTFLWAAMIGIIYPTILIYICIALIIRFRKSERGIIADEVDELCFLNPRSFPTCKSTTPTPAPSVASSSSDCEQNGARVLEISGNKSNPHVWSASFCIVPLTAAFMLGTAFESMLQFPSAAGVLKYKLRSKSQQFSVTLVSLFAALVPLILFFHTPAMRALVFVVISSIKKKIGRTKLTGTGDHPPADFTPPAEVVPKQLSE